MSGRWRWRRAGGVGLKIGISALLLGYLATRIDVDATVRAIVGADRRALAVAGLTFLASNLLGAVQWRTLLRASGLSVSLSRVIVYYLQGLFFGLFLPANVGGDVSRVYDATRHTGEFGGSIAATVMDRLVGFYSIGMMALVALLLGPDQLPPALILVPILGFALVNVTVCLALFSRRISRLLGRLADRLPREGLRTTVGGVLTSLHRLGRRPGLLVGVLALSLVVQVLRIFVHYQVAMAMNIDLPLREFFVIIPVLAVLVALPISFGGIGVRESAAVQLFGHVGVAPAQAVAMQVTTFLLSIVVNLPGWFFFVGRQLRPRSGLTASTPVERADGR